MHSSDGFGSRSLLAAGVALLTVQTFHPVQLLALRTGETAAWLSVILAGLGALLTLWPVASVLSRLPGGNLIDLARLAAGGPGAVATSLASAVAIVYHAGFVLREMSEMVVSANFPHTPQTVAMLSLIACMLVGGLGGTPGLVRLLRGFLPLLALAIAIIVAGSFGWGEVRFLLPFWGPGPGALVMRSGRLVPLFMPAIFMLLAAAPLRDRQRLGTAVALAIALAIIPFVITKVVMVMTLPLPLGQSVTWPLHELARLVIGGRFFERIDAVWMFVWIFGSAGHLAALVHVAAVAYASAFGLPSHRPALPAFVTLAATVGLFAPDQGQTLARHAAGIPLFLGAAFALPLALALLALPALRRRRPVPS